MKLDTILELIESTGLKQEVLSALTEKDNSQILSLQEASELYKISINTLRHWIYLKRLPKLHIGDKLVRVRKGDVERLIHD